MKSKKVSFFFALLCLLFTTAAYSQQSISGTVIDNSNNQPVAGANVSVPGTTTGTITDFAGKFTLILPAGATQVQVSFIGYKTTTIDVRPGGTYSVSLAPDLSALGEVVVVGYGTQRRANLTGAVSTVDTKILEARPIADVGRGLQGSTPGLTVIVPSGELGSDPIMKIRGQFGSMQGGSSPLILVDNVEIPSIQLLNPNDIETISVLKDAASSSIYGAKGSVRSYSDHNQERSKN